jgi:hypothetical protein
MGNGNIDSKSRFAPVWRHHGGADADENPQLEKFGKHGGDHFGRLGDWHGVPYQRNFVSADTERRRDSFVQRGVHPGQSGTVSGKLEVLSNASNSKLVVPVSGEGVVYASGYASVAPLNAPFGRVPVGTKDTEIITVMNAGKKSL